jgi:hypothetical protein
MRSLPLAQLPPASLLPPVQGEADVALSFLVAADDAKRAGKA